MPKQFVKLQNDECGQAMNTKHHVTHENKTSRDPSQTTRYVDNKVTQNIVINL